jgi:TonB family protein
VRLDLRHLVGGRRVVNNGAASHFEALLGLSRTAAPTRSPRSSPALAGTVSVRFDLAASGEVTQATVAESTLPDEAVAACIAKAVKRWTFPKSPGGDL